MWTGNLEESCGHAYLSLSRYKYVHITMLRSFVQLNINYSARTHAHARAHAWSFPYAYHRYHQVLLRFVKNLLIVKYRADKGRWRTKLRTIFGDLPKWKAICEKERSERKVYRDNNCKLIPVLLKFKSLNERKHWNSMVEF